MAVVQLQKKMILVKTQVLKFLYERLLNAQLNLFVKNKKV